MTSGEIQDTYKTIARKGTAELTVKGSRFIGEAIPVESVEQAQAELDIIRKREYDATHHCSAWRVGPAGEEWRYSDDGEPSGTAGPPILRHIEGRDLTNLIVVVTRYYGGTKLGTGGLIRAYGDTAAAALDDAPVVTRIIREPVSLVFGYEDTSPAMHTIGHFDAEIVETNYTEVTEIIVSVRKSETRALVDAFTNALGGRGTATIIRREPESSSTE